MSTHIWVKQQKGYAGKAESLRLTLGGLGLKRVGDERLLRDTPAIRGIIEKVQHLVLVEVRPGQVELTGARSRRAK